MTDAAHDHTFQFAQPLWLLAGLLVCVLIIYLYRRFDRKRESDLAQLVHPRFRSQLFAAASPAMRTTKRILWISAIFLIFVTLARPQYGSDFREVKRRGIDLLFALDTSQSMLADDLSPNRLERARLGIIDFVNRLEGDRIGLIPFAGSAYALCPLTLDYDAFLESLQSVRTNMIPHQGTDIASAIREAERLFKENKNNQKILVLITDGEDLQGDVLSTALKASEEGMVIYTVGVGSPNGSTIPVQYNNGRRDVMRDAQGQEIRTALDEATLKKIAESSKGLYVPLGRGAEGLNTIYQEKLRLVPKSDASQRLERIPLERYEWPLTLAIFLLLLEFFLPDRSKKNRLEFAGSQHLAALFVCALVIGTGFANANTESVSYYNHGTESYHRGEFAQAADALRASLKTPDTSIQQRAYYNLGNTLYRHGQASLQKESKTTIKHWQDALKAYEDAMVLDDTDADARYNYEFVKKKLEQLQQQQPQEQEKKDGEKSDEQKEQEKKDEQQKQQEQEKQQEGKSEEQKKQEQEQKEQEQKEQEQKSQEGEKKDEVKKEGQEGEKSEEQKKKEEQAAQQKAEEGKEPKDQQQQQAQAMQPREMTEEEAKQLLQSLRHEERQVIPIPQQNRRDGKTDNTTKGKTW
jgi:Ca-activated chloride channel family protein